MIDEHVLRGLAERYDEDSRPVYLSLFADLSDPQHQLRLERRAREVEQALDTPMRPLFRRAWDEARKALETRREEDGSRGVAVFSAPEHGFLESYGLGAPLATRLVLDSSPYVRPLARFAHDFEPMLLVLLDSEDAAIFATAAGRAELESQHGHDSLGRHRSGGMSQQRYQRHREGVVNQFYDKVAEDCLRMAAQDAIKRVVVAGPGQAKQQFVERAPKALQDLVVAVEDADFAKGAADPVLAKGFSGVAKEAVQEDARELLKTLKAELRRGDRAATGAFDCWTEAMTGRAQVVILLQGHRVAGRKCEQHQNVFAADAACHCGSKGAIVDVTNEAVEASIRNKVRTVFVQSDPFLESVGGIGAILRW